MAWIINAVIKLLSTFLKIMHWDILFDSGWKANLNSEIEKFLFLSVESYTLVLIR